MANLGKYFAQQQDTHNNPLFWPGTTEGLPVRAPQQPLLKQEEYEQMPVSCDANAALLELPKDMEKYLLVIDRCANGWYTLRHEKFLHYDEKTNCYRVFLQWLENYGEPPNKPGIYNHATGELRPPIQSVI